MSMILKLLMSKDVVEVLTALDMINTLTLDQRILFKEMLERRQIALGEQSLYQ